MSQFFRLLLCLLFAGGVCVSASAQSGPKFKVAPSEVAIPEGAELGKYRRTIQPFPNWTLICDEDLGKRQKICNVKQQIVVDGSNVVFSWSLTATDDGTPMMLFRVPAGVGRGGHVDFHFNGLAAPYQASILNCDAGGCTGLVPVGPQLRRHINEGLSVGVGYRVPGFGEVKFSCPMAGLLQATRTLN